MHEMASIDLFLRKTEETIVELQKERVDSTDRQPVRADDRAEAPAGGLCRTASRVHEKP